QRQIARALDRSRQLALVTRGGAGNAAGDDFAGFGHILLERLDILVIDFLDACGSETAVTTTTEKTGHESLPYCLSAVAGLRSSPSGLRASGDGSVSAPGRTMHRCRSTASLKRKVSSSSSRAACVHSTLSSTSCALWIFWIG